MCSSVRHNNLKTFLILRLRIFTLSYLHTRSCVRAVCCERAVCCVRVVCFLRAVCCVRAPCCVRAVCGRRSAAGVWPACSQLGTDCFWMTKDEVNIVKVTKVEITMVEVTMAGVWPESKRSAVRGFFRDMLS